MPTYEDLQEILRMLKTTYETEVPRADLMAAIGKHTGIGDYIAIRRVIRTMTELNMLQQKGPQVFVFVLEM